MHNDIVIDPGHGGSQRRGNSTPEGAQLGGGQLEREVNFMLAQRVAHHLGGAALTRPAHENRALGERIQRARDGRARAFISLHTHPSSSSEVWVHPRGNAQSRQLAERIRAQLAPVYGGRLQVARGDLAVLSPEHHDRDTAACLVDLAYGGTDLEAAASAIARGVRGYLDTSPALVPHRRYALTQALEGQDDRSKIEVDQNKSYFEVVEDDTVTVPPPAPTAEGQRFVLAQENAIVNAAKTLWDVMKDNRPVANVDSDYANAIPKGAEFSELSGWYQKPSTMKLHYHTESTLLSSDIYLTISWYFNGHYQGGGQYINAATVLATGDVAFAQTINVTASIGNPMNYGTPTAPIAVLPIRVRLEQSNIFQNWNTAWEGILQGNGAGHIDPVS